MRNHREQSGAALFSALSPVMMSEKRDSTEREWMGRNVARREEKREGGKEEDLDWFN